MLCILAWPVLKVQSFCYCFSIQEWSLDEWNEERAKFTFLKDTVEMLVTFGSQTASKYLERMKQARMMKLCSDDPILVL